MIPITVNLEPDVALFYTRVACSAGKSLEQVLADALFKLAGDLSLQSLQAKKSE